jgi:hypothetical protein
VFDLRQKWVARIHGLAICVFMVVFAVSITFKLYDPAPTLRSMIATGFARSIVVVLFYALIGMEIWLVVWAVLFGRSRVFLATATIVLMLFSGYLLFGAATGSTESCGCMGKVGRSVFGEQETLFGLVRNLVLATALWTAPLLSIVLRGRP